MKETHPIPSLAKTTVGLLVQAQQTALNEIAVQTVEAMGLNKDDGWNVDFEAGVASRDVPDASDETPA